MPVTGTPGKAGGQALSLSSGLGQPAREGTDREEQERQGLGVGSAVLRPARLECTVLTHCPLQGGFPPLSQAPPICWFILTATPASGTENQIKKPNAQHPRLRGAGEGGGEAGGGGGGRAGSQAGAAGLPLHPGLWTS